MGSSSKGNMGSVWLRLVLVVVTVPRHFFAPCLGKRGGLTVIIKLRDSNGRGGGEEENDGGELHVGLGSKVRSGTWYLCGPIRLCDGWDFELAEMGMNELWFTFGKAYMPLGLGVSIVM